MVRRWKPQEGTFSRPKAKSRWCVRGHEDEDTGEFRVYSPTPQMESLILFLTMSLALDMDIQIGDLRNAFCQSDPLVRPRGRVFVEPCEGLYLSPGSLIELTAP
eukprot:8467788-Pyramimonas_sp.AAC.1